MSHSLSLGFAKHRYALIKSSGPSDAPKRVSRNIPMLSRWKRAPLAQSGRERKFGLAK
jgi:hypothetical protein